MILTFEQIKANAIKNYKPTPKVEFVETTDNSNVERTSVIVALAIATMFIVFGIIL